MRGRWSAGLSAFPDDWNGRQAVLFDLVNRKFYFLASPSSPQDFIYVAALLMMCALGLFLWTTIAGRLW